MNRAPPKKREGAAMLIVLMVLIMTTATAVFAIHATTVEIRFVEDLVERLPCPRFV